MFKRRPLGSKPQSPDGTGAPPLNSPPPKITGGATAATASSSPPVQGGTPPGPTGRRPRQRNRGRGRKGAPNQNPPQGQRQNQRRPAPPVFPAYIQRDLLLVAVESEFVKGISEVRLKFDPLAKKIPAHVTLLFPEHEKIIGREFLKTFPEKAELPALETLTFSSIQIFDNMYLWLMPDPESREKVKQWHEALVKKLGTHTQEEVFDPHLTLGYVPRSLTTEQAIDFAKNLIKLPLKLQFGTILLEEFAENQNSRVIDSIKLAALPA